MEPVVNKNSQVGAKQEAGTGARIVGWHLLVGVIFAILAAVGFTVVWQLVLGNSQDSTQFDRGILLWASHHQTPVLTNIARALAWFGDPIVIVGFAALATLAGVFIRKIRGTVWTFPIAVAGSGIIIQGIKLAVHRVRPDVFKPLLHESGYSFPSGHSFISVVVYGLIGYFVMHMTKRLSLRLPVALITAALIIAISLSRVYVGVHYPTDVLAGWASGIPWFVTCLGLHEVMARKFSSSGEPVLQAKNVWDPAVAVGSVGVKGKGLEKLR